MEMPAHALLKKGPGYRYDRTYKMATPCRDNSSGSIGCIKVSYDQIQATPTFTLITPIFNRRWPALGPLLYLRAAIQLVVATYQLYYIASLKGGFSPNPRTPPPLPSDLPLAIGKFEYRHCY